MQNNFANHDDFDEYVRAQDKWILDNGWSSPEHKLSVYRFEKFGKSEAGELVEYIVMFRSEGLTNSISVFHGKDKQGRVIWSGYVDSPGEYQVMMSAVNKYIEDSKNNSGDR